MTIDTRDLGTIDGFDIRAALVPDIDATIDDYDMPQERKDAFNDGAWCFVGVVVTASRDDILLGESSIWGVEYGDMPDVDQFVNPLNDGPSFIVNGVAQPDTFANGYGADLVSEAVSEAKQRLDLRSRWRASQPTYDIEGHLIEMEDNDQ